MKNIKLLLLGLFLTLILPLNIFSQAPDGVNYQAVVRNAIGLPINNQAVDVRFSIHQGSPTGTVVFTEVHSTTTNQFGLINLELGSVDNVAFSVINWGTGGAYYLQIEVDDGSGSGFEDLGASQLLSVPYALFARSAATGAQGFNSLIDTVSATVAECPTGGYKVLTGLDANANTVLDAGEVATSFVVCNGSTGAPSTSDTSATNELQTLSISNDTIFLTSGGFVVLPSLSGDNDWQQGPGVVYNNTDYVGIGTNTPLSQLMVATNDTVVASFVGTNPNFTALTVASLNPSAATGMVFLNGPDSGIIGLDPANKIFWLSHSTPNGHTGIYADSAVALYGQQIANVGSDLIFNQTKSIYNEVDTIYNYSSSGTIVHANQGGFLTDSLYVLGNNMANLNWVLANDGAGQAVWTDPSTLGLGGGLWQSNTPDIYFNTGNVGIGTTTPSEMLHVESTAAAQNAILKLSANGFVGPTTGINLGNSISSSADVLFEPGTSDDLIIRNNVASVGVADIKFQTGGANDRLVITEGGDVGIGTATPSNKLSLVGNTHIQKIYMERSTGGGESMSLGNGTTHSTLVYSNTGGFYIAPVTDPSVNPPAQADTLGFSMDGNGNVGIKSGPPSATLDVVGTFQLVDGTEGNGKVLTSDASGNASWQPVSAPAVSRINDLDNNTWVETDILANGTEDKIRFSLNGTERVIIDNNGLVGIGTVNPGAPLHVANGPFGSAGAAVLMSNNANPTNASKIGLYKSRGSEAAPTAIQQNDEIGTIEFTAWNSVSYSNGALIKVTADENFGSTAMGSHMEFHLAPLSMGPAQEVMRLTNAGWLGLGTTNPLVQMHIADEAQTTAAIQSSHNGAADGSSNLTFVRSRGSIATPTAVQNGDRLGKLEWVGWNSSSSSFEEKASIRVVADETYNSGSTASHMEFHVNPAGQSTTVEAMMISDAGNVGIGTGAPTNRLHIQGGSVTIDNGANPYTLPTADGTNNQVLTTDGSGNVSWANSGGGSAWLLAGNSGTNPAADAIGTLDAQDLVFMTNGAERMRMTSTGRIGIGITTPISPFNLIYNGTDQEGMLINYTNSTAASSGMGFFVAANNTGTAPVWGAGIQITSSTNASETVGLDALNIASGNINYGVRTSVGGSGTTNYGVYSEVSGAVTNWAAFFADGNVYIGDTIVIPTNAGQGHVLTSDAAGNGVWKPKQVGFMARPAGIGQAFGAGAFVDFSATDFNDGGFYNPAASEFVAPAPGVYHFTANVDVIAAGFATAHMVMYKNGGQVLGEVYENVQGGNRYSIQISVTVQLNVGDQINLYMDAGGGPSVQIQSIGGSSFSGHLVYAY